MIFSAMTPGRDAWWARLWLLRRRWRLLLRLVASTTISYAIATYVLGHHQAFFAPMAAAIALTAGSAGVRARVAIELVVGVALGVLVGEIIVLMIGRGWWQIGLVAVLTVVAATLSGVTGLAMTQAINAAVLLVAVAPAPGTNPALSRFLDALIGGLLGLLVTFAVPRNAVRDIDRDVRSVVLSLADVLARTSRALRTGDAALADRALAEARATQGAVDRMRSTASGVAEVARMAPMRWHQRGAVERYFGSTSHLDNAIRDARVLARRSAAMLRNDEQAPPGLADAVDDLAAATRELAGGLAQEFSGRGTADEVRDSLVSASHRAIGCLTGVITVNNASIAAQVRSLAADLLLAAGVSRDELDRLLDD